MDKKEAYEIEEILYNMKSRGIDVDRLLEVLTPMFDNEREKEFRNIRNLRYSWCGYDPRKQLFRALNLNTAKTVYQEALDEETYLNNEINDIMHALELLDQTDDELLDYAKQIKELKKRRRRAKNFAECVKPIADFVFENKDFMKRLNKVLGEVDRVYSTLDTRNYYPRAKTSLEEAFKKAHEKDNVQI